MAKLKWRDSEDVYKPISLSLHEFLQENQNRINQQNNRGIEELYRQLRHNRMNVFVEPEAETQLIKHLSIDPYNETGGVLVGQAYLCPDTKNHYTEIVGSIAAPYTVGNRVHFQFTSECWQAILNNQKQHFSDTTIVGWYHSHPGHGIFLSGTDLNTQRLCFKQIWQIAVVYDPLRKEIGYFYGADGKRIDGIYLQEISQNSLSLSKHHQRQLTWRQPGPTLPALPPSSSGHVDNSFTPIEQQVQERNLPITEPTQTRGQNKNLNFLLVFIIVILAVALLTLLIYLIIFPSFQSQQLYPQNTELQPPESNQSEPKPTESELPKSNQPEPKPTESELPKLNQPEPKPTESALPKSNQPEPKPTQLKRPKSQ